MLPVGTCIGADQHAPEGAFLTMVLFTSLVFLRQCRVRLRLGDTPGLDKCRFSDSIERRTNGENRGALPGPFAPCCH